jgi:hypothetical protein
MLVPGVLSGSKGPLLYPPDEVRKSPDDWNHIPIVVYHPMKDGKPVSARSPTILSKYGVGFVFHSRTDSKGVLKGEGWLDVEATRRVDKSVLDSVQLGKPIELSTGLFVDDEPAPEGAIFNDHRGTRKYVGIARNYKPDHLAILPSGKGACSLADGCGVLINEAAMEAYQVIINELEAEAISIYFPDVELDLLTANKFNPNQPRDKAGRFATVAEGTAAVSKAQERVAKAQAALKEAKATLKVEKDGLLVARKGLAEVKGIEKARSPAGQKAIEKAKASTTEAHATGKRLKELSDRLTGGVGRQGKGTADLQAEGRSEASKALAGIRTKAHAAAVAEGFGILPGKTVAETKATISRHIETRIGSVARSRLVDRPVHTTDPAATDSTAGHAAPKIRTGTGKSTLPKHEEVAATALATVKSLEQTTRVSPTLDKVHAAVTAAHPNTTKEQIKDVLVGLHKDRQIVLERHSGPQHQIPPAVKAVAITGKDLGRDSTHRGHTEYHTTARIPTGGSRPTTGTPTAPKSAATKADSAPDFHTLAHTTHETNKLLTHPTTGLPPVIPRLYEEVARMHPGLKEKDFHEHLKELQKRDIATQQVWDTSVKITPENTGGYTADRFPLGGRSGIFPIGWVAFRPDATSRINADAGRAKASAGTASPRSTSTAPKPAASPRAGKSGKSGKSVGDHIQKTQSLLATSVEVDKATVKTHVDQMGKDLNKAQVLEVARSIDLHAPKTKKDALAKIHDKITSQKGMYRRGLE